MFDIHTHLLPGIDDGSKNLQDTQAMFSIINQSGVKTVVATPHYYHNMSVEDFIQIRNDAFVSVENLPERPEIVLGAEVWLEYGMHKNEKLRELCIGDTDYMLIEMPFVKWNKWVYDELFKISAKHEVNIIIAHLERYINLVKMDDIYRLCDMDVKIQVNVDRLGGVFFKSPAEKLMKKGLVDFIGSDCHNTTTRKPCMEKAKKRICSLFGDDYFDMLMKNAENMLKNKIL